MPAAQLPTPVLVAFALVFFLFLLITTALFAMFFSTWIQAFLSGVPLTILELIGMRLRQTDIKAVVRALIMARHGGVGIPSVEMEKAWAQGVDLEKVTLAIIEARKQNMDLTFQDLVDAEVEGRLAEKLATNNTSHLEETAV
jgi:uncharacterized protein YqfA (UPF0365 family)